MTTEASNNVSNKTDSANGRNPVIKTMRSVLLAAVGALALGKEEIEAIVNRLVEKGEIAEQDGRDLINDMIERRKKEYEEAEEKAEEKTEGMLDLRIESILNRMNIPSKSDVESLSRKVSELSKKVDTLNAKLPE